MAEREEEAHTDRLLALLEQLPRGVVDGRDVIGVEGMPQAEGVGQASEAEEGWMTSAVCQQGSPADEMDEGDSPVEAAKPDPLSRIEGSTKRLTDRRHSHLSVVARSLALMSPPLYQEWIAVS